MPVYWTIQAHRHLRQALAREIVDNPGVLKERRKFLDKMLTGAFKGAAVVVKDQVIGYRPKQDQFTLLIEAFGAETSENSGPFVVKIGPEKVKDDNGKDKLVLGKELQGWEACRPPGLKHDLVFLGLDRRAKLPFKAGEPWICLVYGDAQQSLGVSYTVTFEEAAMECARSGFPKLGSVVFVINQLYERIGHLLYPQSFVRDPTKVKQPLELPKLDECLKKWDEDPSCLLARRDVNAMANTGVEKFIDPVDYFKYVQGKVEPAEEGKPKPGNVAFVPRMLRGCSHGDLHGRNILVGIVRDQAMWPTVFDYEDMGPGNLIGWDFVKLETELKTRAYADMFSNRSIGEFADAVQQAEAALDKWTEDCHNSQEPWPEAGGDPEKMSKVERLTIILMAVRRMASVHLGTNRGRAKEWLEEYYFLLAAYGVYTAWFDNLANRERMAAMISAGVAASRLKWPRTDWFTPLPPTTDEILAATFPSYHKPFELARQLGRSGNEKHRETSIRIFDHLAARYPNVLAIGQERVFVLMEQKEAALAEKALQDLERTFPNLDQESLCRWGRHFKDKGDGHRDNAHMAETFYRESLAKYDRAYRIREGYYPGINKATVLLILGSEKARPPGSPAAPELEESARLAGEILKNRPHWHASQPEDLTIWFPATAGEAHLLRQEWKEAEAEYRQALGQEKLATAHSRDSMRKQVGRIVKCFKKLGVKVPPPFDEPDKFFEVNPGPEGPPT